MLRPAHEPSGRLRYSARGLLAAALVAALLVPEPSSAGEYQALGSAPGQARSRLHTIPFSSGEADPARDFIATDPQDHDLVLVQWSNFGQRGVVQRIASSGAKLVQPLAPVSYLVWATAEQTHALRELPGIRWAGVLPPATRVSGNITDTTSELRVAVVGDATRILGLTGTVGDRTFTAMPGSIVEVAGDARVAAALATLPNVYSVAASVDDPQLRDELAAQVVAEGTPRAGVEPGYRRFLRKIKADGSGVIVSQVDSGVDFNHPELSDRIKACISYAPVDTCLARNHDDVLGHGTHTLGILLGTGSLGITDLDGYNYGLGIAPGAKAVVQNAASPAALGAFDGGYRPLYRDAHDAGAILSANSWGPSNLAQGYDETTREFDSIVRDINEDRKGDQPMGLVFSIANGRGGVSTQGVPEEGKNLIAVGASGNRGLDAPGLDDLCTCTAHGPALDGRLLPTLVAPGQAVISTRATQGTLCGVPLLGSSPTEPSLEIPPSPFHAGCTGTSMASPHVSGGYAVFVDWYRNHHSNKTPSPALVKAAFVNGADDLAGGLDANGFRIKHIPNNQQGWGRFNLGNVIDGWRRGAVHIDQSVVLTRSDQSHTIRVKAVDPSKQLKVSLVWTDALGPGLGGKTPAWVNDLDLIVRLKKTWRGNVFSKGWSTVGGKADRKNNIENVFLKKAGDGVYTIIVKAANIIGKGLPNRAGKTNQDFALVATNAREVRLSSTN